MPNSLRCRIKKLGYKRVLSDKDVERIINALDIYDVIKALNQDNVQLKCKWCKHIILVNKDKIKKNSRFLKNILNILNKCAIITIKLKIPQSRGYKVCFL